jgi:hypothetical protein
MVKGTTYSVKLKLEFAILSKLVEVTTIALHSNELGGHNEFLTRSTMRSTTLIAIQRRGFRSRSHCWLGDRLATLEKVVWMICT